jgi:hypothetical protein
MNTFFNYLRYGSTMFINKMPIFNHARLQSSDDLERRPPFCLY